MVSNFSRALAAVSTMILAVAASAASAETVTMRADSCCPQDCAPKIVPVTKPAAKYIVFSPKNPNAPKYAKLLDDGLDAMRKSGDLATILAKYHVSDWQ